MSWFDIIIFWGPTAVLCVLAFMVGQTFREWLKHDYKKHWKEWKIKFPLKPLYIGVALVVFVPLVILFFSLLDDVAGIPTNESINQDQVRNLAIAFVGTISGIGALFGVYLAILRSEENTRQNEIAKSQADTALEESKIANEQSKIAQQQANTAEQGLITDRLNKATEGLGKNENGEPILEIRIGSLYALERIAQDSIRDHIQIMEILCTYIRHNRPLSTNPAEVIPISHDIQTAITIIGRRGRWEDGEEYLKEEILNNYTINLFGCNLCGANFSNANLAKASFIGSDMNNSLFNDTDLTKARLGNTDLTNAWFERATLKDTKFDDATTVNVHALYNDFSESLYLTQKQINQMFLGVGVKLEEGLVHPQEDTKYIQDYYTFEDFIEARDEWLKETGR